MKAFMIACALIGACALNEADANPVAADIAAEAIQVLAHKYHEPATFEGPRDSRLNKRAPVAPEVPTEAMQVLARKYSEPATFEAPRDSRLNKRAPVAADIAAEAMQVLARKRQEQTELDNLEDEDKTRDE